MAEHTGHEGQPVVGTVAAEAARLLDALAGARAASGRAHSGPGPACEQCGRAAGATDADPPGAQASGAGASGARASGEQPAVCRICPLCQLLAVVRSVSPETIDRLADFAAAVTSTLRDAAAVRWAETAQPAGAPGRPAAGRESRSANRRPPVEDITVEDGAVRDEGAGP